MSRKSLWSWYGFETLEEQAKPAEQLDKATRNKSMTLDLADYTESMTALHHILTKTPMSQSIPYVLPPLTAALLKEGLRTDWTAEQIGHLVVKYESEWYADESLSKWNEIDDFYEKERKAKQQEIEKELEKKNITKPVEREHVLKALTERFKFHLNEWQIEKVQRIKPSLWWSEVATAQAAQSTNTEQNTTAEANQPVLSNLPADGKVWHLHPVGMGVFVIPEDYTITVKFIEKVTGKIGSWFNGKGSNKKFEEMFQKEYANIYQFDKEKFVKLLNNALDKYEITGAYHKAHFLSQCFHESANFESTLEFASGSAYDPGKHSRAVENGNTEIGDGPKYKGRGLIQLTWKNNYSKYSDFSGLDFVSNPDLIAQNMEYAIDVSCWFWRYNGGVYRKYNANGDINILINNEKNNVKLITLAINGGSNGLSHRMNIFNMIKQEWNLV